MKHLKGKHMRVIFNEELKAVADDLDRMAQDGHITRDQADIARTWQRILGSVRSYRDLDPALLGRVEELIDFVTAEPDAPTR